MIEQEWAELHEAGKHLFLTICEALHIDRLHGWLEKKLTK